MRRALILFSFAVLALPAAAGAKSTPPTCVRATGATGEWVTGQDRDRVGVDRLWSATASGVRAGQAIRIPRQLGCATVAAAPDGRAVLATLAEPGPRATGARLLVATRDAGGRFGRAVEVARSPTRDLAESAAIGASGDAVVVLGEGRPGGRIRAVRIGPDGSAGAAVTLARGLDDAPPLAAGVDARGRTTVAWADPADGVQWRAAARGRRFGRAGALPDLVDVGSLALAVAPGGAALLAGDGYDGTALAERAPAARDFRFTQTLDGLAGAPAVALSDDGAAVVAGHDVLARDTGASVAWRAPGGRFGAVRHLTADTSGPWGSAEVELALASGVGDVAPELPQVGLGSRGELLVTWVRGRRGPLTEPTVAWLAHGFVTGTSLSLERVGTPSRAVVGAAPVLTADGGAGIAWTDAAGSVAVLGLEGERRPGRVHVTFAGVPPAASPSPPRVFVRVPRHLALRAADGVPVAVRCSRPCDVRVSAGRGAESRTLRHGSAALVVGASSYAAPFGTPAGRRVEVRAAATAPGGDRASHDAALTVVRLKPAPRPPVVLDLRAYHRGHSIVVTWRTDRPARRVDFAVDASRRLRGGDRVAVYGSATGGGRTRHRVVLHTGGYVHPRDLRRARWVTVMVFPRDRDAHAVDPDPVRIR